MMKHQTLSILALSALLSACEMPSQMPSQSGQVQAQGETAPAAKASECGHLSKVNSTGELLKQIYDFYGDECIRKENAAVLSGIWGVEVLSEGEQEEVFRNKPGCTSRLDGIAVSFRSVIEKNMSIITNKCYEDTFGGFNTDETLTAHLPGETLHIKDFESLTAPPPPRIADGIEEYVPIVVSEPNVPYPITPQFRFLPHEVKDNACEGFEEAYKECRYRTKEYRWTNPRSGAKIAIDISSTENITIPKYKKKYSKEIYIYM